MANEPSSAVGTALDNLFQHLGIERAHVAAGHLVLTDWQGLVTLHPHRVGALTLISPMSLDPGSLQALGARVLVLTGDQGQPAQNSRQLLAALPQAASHTLHDYTSLPWSDVLADRSGEVAHAILDFLDRQEGPVAAVNLPEQQGEAGGIFYHVRGAGPPLVLMPLDLAPSQWEPVIPLLSARYCTVTLGGPLLGPVSLLEGRGRSDYLNVVRDLLDVVRVQPGEAILEVGSGSGVVLRELARRTAGANRITGVEINRYLLREATALARLEELSDQIGFQEGSAEALPLASNSVDVSLSCTVMEEGDANRMLDELVRVTRPGGRVAAIVRVVDMPCWVNLGLSPQLRARVDPPLKGGVSPGGCADASLYRRFRSAGLTDLTFFPRFTTVTSSTQAARLAAFVQRVVGAVTVDEAAEWRQAVAQGEADDTFFIAMPHHCAVGTKPM